MCPGFTELALHLNTDHSSNCRKFPLEAAAFVIKANKLLAENRQTDVYNYIKFLVILSFWQLTIWVCLLNYKYYAVDFLVQHWSQNVLPLPKYIAQTTHLGESFSCDSGAVCD